MMHQVYGFQCLLCTDLLIFSVFRQGRLCGELDY